MTPHPTGLGAPRQLTEIAARTDSALAEVFRAERARWSRLDPILDVPLGVLEAFVVRGGKRLRPAYVHWGWVLGGGDPFDDDHLSVCCAVELLQAFALVHDDVMDGSSTRRGHPTVWADFVDRHKSAAWRGEPRRFGEAAAILVGDIAMVLADRQLLDVAQPARAVWDTLRSELNMGQFLDVYCTATDEATVDKARLIMCHKTAGYTIVRPMQLGAALSGRCDLADAIAAHGTPLGTAFQLRDDMLGAFGDETRTGKPVGEDLRVGKPTMLLAEALSVASSTQREVLDRVGHRNLDEDDVAAIQQVLTETGAVDASERETERLVTEAVEALDALPDLHHSREALLALADFIVTRDL